MKLKYIMEIYEMLKSKGFKNIQFVIDQEIHTSIMVTPHYISAIDLKTRTELYIYDMALFDISVFIRTLNNYYKKNVEWHQIYISSIS